MSLALISRSADLQRLRDEGYDIEISGSYLLINDVPYVDAAKKVRRATLATTLNLGGDQTAPPDTHVCLFTGDYPCDKDGREIAGLRHDAPNTTIRGGLVAKFSFSNKPPNGYANYYDKMIQYIRIISDPAAAIDPLATAQTKPVATDRDEDTAFRYLDTASSRAGINAVSNKVKGLKIGIIGLGGTGSYVLDLVAKTPVAEIHLFDDDRMYTHSAFRAPGAASIDELRTRPEKVAYFSAIYSKMHKGIVPHATKILEPNLDELNSLDFVFICIDKGQARRVIVDRLQGRGIKFIDVGMGIELIDDMLIGNIRVTTSTDAKRDHFAGRVPFTDEGDDEDYKHNIQIADLNALNGVLAVMKWKKLYGLYQDLTNEHSTIYQLNTHDLSNDECEP